MDAFLSQVLDNSDANRINALASALKGSEQSLAAEGPALLPALQQLMPGHHSLGAVYLMHALLKSNTLTGQPQALAEFIDLASAHLKNIAAYQIAAVPELLCFVCRKYKELLVTCGNPRRGIRPLEAALRALQPSSEVLTPIHTDFFQLCLLAKCYSAAAGVLGEEVYDVDPPRTALTPTDLFLYCYYGALLLIGRKQYGRALELLLTSITAPALVGNAIVVAAFKKYVLVALIHTGSVPPLPKMVSSRVKQTLESEAKPYLDISAAYASHSAERLRRVLEQFAALLQGDTNTGLARLVVGSLVSRNIQRLTQTYLSLSLQDIASQVGLASAEEAELHLLRMVAEGEIHARIAGHMVTFLEDTQQYTGGAMLERLDTCIRRVMRLNERVARAHDIVTTDKAYLAKVTAKGATGVGMGVLDPGVFGGSSQGP